MESPSPVREIVSLEFDELAKPIFDYIQTEVRDEKWRLNWPHLSSEWKKWMGLGIARTWYARPGALLGGVFSKDLFSGTPRALVVFWVATPEARKKGLSVKVLNTFKQECKRLGAKPAAAVHCSVSPEGLSKTYIRHGAKLSELIFSWQ